MTTKTCQGLTQLADTNEHQVANALLTCQLLVLCHIDLPTDRFFIWILLMKKILCQFSMVKVKPLEFKPKSDSWQKKSLWCQKYGSTRWRQHNNIRERLWGTAFRHSSGDVYGNYATENKRVALRKYALPAKSLEILRKTGAIMWQGPHDIPDINPSKKIDQNYLPTRKPEYQSHIISHVHMSHCNVRSKIINILKLTYGWTDMLTAVGWPRKHKELQVRFCSSNIL